MRVVWTVSALDEIARIHDYMAEFNSYAARRVVESLLREGDGLADFPHRGRPVGGGIRELTSVYPYIIRYEVAGGMLVVLRVRHGGRQQ